MKKTVLILMCFLFTSTALLKAQAPCDAVTAEAFAMDPQSGAHNYFGVRVTLAQAYSQDVTVSGYIFDDGNGGDTNHPFTLTITAGNPTAETEATFYQTDPTAVAAVSISSVTPCPTVGTPEDTLDLAGQLHNEYQEYLLSYITSQNLDLTDTITLKQAVESKSQEFFQSKGITQTLPYQIHIANCGSNAYQFSTSGYSSVGTAILNDLKSLITNYDPVNDANFFSSLRNLQQQALNLPDPIEVYTVGIPVTITIYSFNYWKEKADYWAAIFMEQDSLRNLQPLPIALNKNHERMLGYNDLKNISGPSGMNNYFIESEFLNAYTLKKCNVNLWKLGGADAAGAVSGGYAGVALGPGGAFAGAVLGSSANSLYNLSNQVISCYVSWWPF